MRQSRIGTIVAGVGTTVFGLGGVAVGMFMKIHEPTIAPAQALPLFAAHYFSPVLSGIMLGAILITLITCDPPWTGTHRIIVSGSLDAQTPHTGQHG